MYQLLFLLEIFIHKERQERRGRKSKIKRKIERKNIKEKEIRETRGMKSF